MYKRELKIIETDKGSYAEFNHYVQGQPHRIKRLLTKKELTTALDLITADNEIDIDNFCYSIE